MPIVSKTSKKLVSKRRINISNSLGGTWKASIFHRDQSVPSPNAPMSFTEERQCRPKSIMPSSCLLLGRDVHQLHVESAQVPKNEITKQKTWCRVLSLSLRLGNRRPLLGLHVGHASMAAIAPKLPAEAWRLKRRHLGRAEAHQEL